MCLTVSEKCRLSVLDGWLVAQGSQVRLETQWLILGIRIIYNTGKTVFKRQALFSVDKNIILWKSREKKSFKNMNQLNDIIGSIAFPGLTYPNGQEGSWFESMKSFFLYFFFL